MTLGLILIGVALAVAYFHYAQGLFSAVISATLALLAAVYAVGSHEAIVAGLLGGKYPDYAPAAVLVVMFAVIYTLGRVLFDRLVPGNVMLPNTADRAAAAVVGLVAGACVAGVLAIAAQLLPFGPSIAGYSRYELATRTGVSVPRVGKQTIDLEIPDELRVDSFDPARGQSLLIPFDDLLLGVVNHLSGTGSLSGPVDLAAVQPDYLDTLFGQRLGVQVGGKRSAVNAGPVDQVTVPKPGVAVYARLAQVPGEVDAIRPVADVAKTREPGAGRVLLAVRARIDKGASDADNTFRFSPAAVRLVVGGEDGRPIGTLEAGAVLVENKVDDPLFLAIAGDAGVVDFVFEAPTSAVVGADGDAPKVADGVFIEIKRFARVDLSGMPVVNRLPPDPAAAVRRKAAVQELITQAPAPAAAPAEAPAETLAPAEGAGG